MLAYNEIKQKKVIVYEGEPYEVLSSHVFRKQQRKPVNATKLKNLISGKVTEYSFHQSESVEEAELNKKNLKYLYRKGNEVWLCEENNPAERLSVPYDQIQNELNYTRVNDLVTALIYDDEIIGFSTPLKVVLEVKDAPPNIKGNTSSGGNKVVTLETGAKVTTPLFIEAGDKIEVNTETGEYTGRA
ncbi:hypothetical protein COW81_00675 [Candidatus Campbellbacteria bacterium CG22_combo_CG10-13_8_21_14_all_36_13]|uniref:Elongation factor P C-terminal domain-containing protein n=1 Tax=Candidatus Campbellbacteria bacterium CG22_combo_CG10-13_8_21_14_all_36_13 TaxID=1974529 RepID=A0A2H0DYX1_9BACT|nr:MAG: hypothetical protein COW81_00675 [Candidatus Campbellbacteria bacterium CG22_combo_CG10-13_8_21_14_all_36_13]